MFRLLSPCLIFFRFNIRSQSESRYQAYCLQCIETLLHWKRSAVKCRNDAPKANKIRIKRKAWVQLLPFLHGIRFLKVVKNCRSVFWKFRQRKSNCEHRSRLETLFSILLVHLAKKMKAEIENLKMFPSVFRLNVSSKASLLIYILSRLALAILLISNLALSQS